MSGPVLSPGDRILDVGAGVGSIEERLPRHDIIGVDISKAMVQTARARVGGGFLVGDARALPIVTSTMDSVFFVATLEFVPDVEEVLDDPLRVLRPDGALVALVLNTESDYVQSSLERDGSSLQRMVHGDSERLASAIERWSNADREYFLGIADRSVVETEDPDDAAIVAIAGNPTS